MDSWSGRGVLVTGSTSGIGAATARRFGRAGAFVTVHGLDDEGAAVVARDIEAAGGRATVFACDLAEEEASAALVATAVERMGRLDVLVNNAGANVFRGTQQTSTADWQACLDLDLRAVWLTSRAAARVMTSPGAIVNIASNHAFSTLPGAFPYNVAKAGIVALTQSLAIELASQGIRANTVCPGYIDTAINDRYFASFPDPAAQRTRAEALHPLGRLGDPDDVAAAIAFLASEEQAGFITGTTLVVDGGRSALLQDPPG